MLSITLLSFVGAFCFRFLRFCLFCELRVHFNLTLGVCQCVLPTYSFYIHTYIHTSISIFIII